MGWLKRFHVSTALDDPLNGIREEEKSAIRNRVMLRKSPSQL